MLLKLMYGIYMVLQDTSMNIMVLSCPKYCITVYQTYKKYHGTLDMQRVTAMLFWKCIMVFVEVMLNVSNAP